jgi:hypothetical protein
MAPRRGHFFVEQTLKEGSSAEALSRGGVELKRVEEGRG